MEWRRPGRKEKARVGVVIVCVGMGGKRRVERGEEKGEVTGVVRVR